MRSALLAICALCAALGAAAGGKMDSPPVTVRSTVRGAFDVFKAGERIGRENFVRRVLSNNTAIYESVFDVMEGEELFVSGNNRLEVEEDSGFPRSYYTQRRIREPNGEKVREVSVEMYANVAVVTERQDGAEGRRVVALPAGSLFIEGNTAHHLAVALERYDRIAGGAQSFRAFDPLGVAATRVTLEAAGDSTLSGVGRPGTALETGGPAVHFRYRAGEAPSIDFFVDGDGRIVRIDAGPSGLEYRLVSVEEESGGADADG